MVKIFSVISIIVLLAACGTTETANRKLLNYKGKDIQTFLSDFDDFGSSYNVHEKSYGKLYVWKSMKTLNSTNFNDMECHINVKTDSAEKITSIGVAKDTPTAFNDTACGATLSVK